jgi:alkaline phosphatase D
MWSTLSRRRFLQVLGTTGLLAGAPAIVRGRSIDSAYDLRSDLFSLGVASGDPDSHSVVLWTRLAPDPLEGGGMPALPVPVYWEVATDPDMRRIVRRGNLIAQPINGHAVHVVARGLPSNSTTPRASWTPRRHFWVPARRLGWSAA